MQPKIRIKSKKASNESCSELNLIPKSLRAHISIPLPKSGVEVLQRLICLKSYNVQKWKIRFTLWLNASKNTHDIKKSCLELNSIQKSLKAHMSITPRGFVQFAIWLFRI